jgi:predicted RNA-binding Zn-ribbon protein involved in translation (DUF1610 family)
VSTKKTKPTPVECQSCGRVFTLDRRLEGRLCPSCSRIPADIFRQRMIEAMPDSRFREGIVPPSTFFYSRAFGAQPVSEAKRVAPKSNSKRKR